MEVVRFPPILVFGDEIVLAFLGDCILTSELATLRTNMSTWFAKPVQGP